MKAYSLTAIGVLLVTSPLLATTANVYFSARAEAYDATTGESVSLDQLYPGCILTWTISTRVTGENQGLAFCLVSMGIKSLETNYWAPHTVDSGGLSYPAVYKAPGATGQIGTVVSPAAYGGMGAYRGATLGWPDKNVFFIDQMCVGYLEWKARRYRTSPLPAGWVGEQVWGVGLDSRKSEILAAGEAGTYDLFQGTVDLSDWEPGSYRADFNRTLMIADVIDTGINLNLDAPSVPTTEVGGQVGELFQFTIVPEPATLLLLAGAALLARPPRTRGVSVRTERKD